MIEIDGCDGEGGGQIVRSSLAFSAMTGKPLRLTNIRGGRKKPGLLRQHLTGLKAITQICDAAVDCDGLGASELTFEPQSVRGGDYSFEVGSAGSAVLVAQTILPALMMADSPTRVTIGGGTHAAWAPPYDFFERCYLPQLTKMNARVSSSLHSHGFYPAGGGQIEMTVDPSAPLCGLDLTRREGRLRRRVIALVSELPLSIAQRECSTVCRKLDWPQDAGSPILVSRSGGPGNVVMIECKFDNVTELFIGFGKTGVRAEQVARQTVREAKPYLNSDIPVGEYLADQLLLPMSMAASQGHGSQFRTGALSMHSRTQISVIKRFLDIRIETQAIGDSVQVCVQPPAE